MPDNRTEPQKNTINPIAAIPIIVVSVGGFIIFLMETAIKTPLIKSFENTTRLTKIGDEKFKEYYKLSADYDDCVKNLGSKAEKCNEIKAKSKAILLEIEQNNEQMEQNTKQMRQNNIKSYQSLCDSDPTNPKDYCGKLEELKREASQ
ncbi:hypothetical protein [Nostoc sp.]|uniref:hypothetical protein n=1 Tax=Nostoc sp. TaxID=1180 RepID=UPI002FF0318D